MPPVASRHLGTPACIGLHRFQLRLGFQLRIKRIDLVFVIYAVYVPFGVSAREFCVCVCLHVGVSSVVWLFNAEATERTDDNIYGAKMKWSSLKGR